MKSVAEGPKPPEIDSEGKTNVEVVHPNWSDKDAG